MNRAVTPVYIVVSLWVRDGQQARFEAYERKVARIMARHSGVIERVVRCSRNASARSDDPFEVHVLRFPSQEQYETYRADPDRTALAAERAEVITRTDVVVGAAGPGYAE